MPNETDEPLKDLERLTDRSSFNRNSLLGRDLRRKKKREKRWMKERIRSVFVKKKSGAIFFTISLLPFSWVGKNFRFLFSLLLDSEVCAGFSLSLLGSIYFKDRVLTVSERADLFGISFTFICGVEDWDCLVLSSLPSERL